MISAIKSYKIFVIGALLLGLPEVNYAQYPEKDIKVIVHVSPGGGTDAMARLVLKYVGIKLGTSFIIENFKGAGGQVGYTTLSLAKPDGYTIGTITTASIITHELTRESVSYNLKDSFIPIARIVSDPSVVIVRADSPIKSFKMLKEMARKEPDMISCGGSMVWGTQHIHSVMLDYNCGIKLNFIPFDGLAESRNNLLGGHIDVAVGGTAEYMSLLETGKVRALVVASKERLTHLPSVPTYTELGYNLVIGSDRGLAAPADTPMEYVRLISETVKEVLMDPEFLKQAEKMKFKSVLAFLDSNDFGTYLQNLRDDLETYIGYQPK